MNEPAVPPFGRSLVAISLLVATTGVQACSLRGGGDDPRTSPSDPRNEAGPASVDSPPTASGVLASAPSASDSASESTIDEELGSVAGAAPAVAPVVGPGGDPSVAKPSPAASCPDDMVLVTGEYCPDVRHTCLRWMDPPGTYGNFRCAVYAKPARCASSERVAMRFCIDRDEYTKPGDVLPEVQHSWTSASAVCAQQGKRLCLESEWQFACEGEEMRPYPYGFVRDARACNIDRTTLGKPNAGLRDLRAKAGSHPECVSPFGVRDMSGNVEEWATLDQPKDPKDRSSMKGAWWLPGRNHCRAATTGHGESYAGSQVGVRCCKDVTSI